MVDGVVDDCGQNHCCGVVAWKTENLSLLPVLIAYFRCFAETRQQRTRKHHPLLKHSYLLEV